MVFRTSASRPFFKHLQNFHWLYLTFICRDCESMTIPYRNARTLFQFFDRCLSVRPFLCKFSPTCFVDYVLFILQLYLRFASDSSVLNFRFICEKAIGFIITCNYFFLSVYTINDRNNAPIIFLYRVQPHWQSQMGSS